ncbi:MAG: hypothetical protein F4X59_13495 [Holophagales bacterium]|nr:hypothetical protein [Holophagales bacterium]MYC11127.1 hypothetical protein [Holophagales bacterium]
MKNNGTVVACLLGCLALAFAAAPAASQLVQAPADELYTAPWFADLRGMSDPNPRRNGHGGGFVAQALRNAADDGWESATYSYVCGGVTLTQPATPDAGTGLVAALIDCESDTAYDTLDLRVHGVESGGWYWVFRPIGDDVAAAAAPLIRMDVVAQAPRQLPLEPNVGRIQADRHEVMVDDDGRGSGGATLFSDDENRLFDVFVHPAAALPPTPCSGEFLNADATDEGCGLGVADDWGLALADEEGDALTGPVVRPATTGSVPVTATLSIATGHLVGAGCAPGVMLDLTGGMSGETVLDLPGAVTVSGANPANPGDCPAAELTFSWMIEVAPDTTRCATTNADRGTAQTVRVAPSDLTGATPGLPDELFAEFQVVCADAAAASSAGRELVPDVGLQ